MVEGGEDVVSSVSGRESMCVKGAEDTVKSMSGRG